VGGQDGHVLVCWCGTAHLDGLFTGSSRVSLLLVACWHNKCAVAADERLWCCGNDCCLLSAA
jgi:hypothetical protein